MEKSLLICLGILVIVESDKNKLKIEVFITYNIVLIVLNMTKAEQFRSEKSLKSQKQIWFGENQWCTFTSWAEDAPPDFC